MDLIYDDNYNIVLKCKRYESHDKFKTCISNSCAGVYPTTLTPKPLANSCTYGYIKVTWTEFIVHRNYLKRYFIND